MARLTRPAQRKGGIQMDERLSLLKEMSELPGVPGYEEEV
jgi:hypothetical protein